MGSDDEREVSVFAARDLDRPQVCSRCGQTRRVAALDPGPQPVCGPCWYVGAKEDR
jgi:hypothetical protein